MTDGLTAQQRREVCVHEAAHAVVNRLGGGWAYGAEVAPEGATDWSTEGRKGGLLTGLWGCCHTSDALGWRLIHWDDDVGFYVCDRKGYTDLLHQCGQYHRGCAKESRRQLRANICGTLAGPIADAIRDGQPEGSVCLVPDDEHGEDLTVAEALCRLLPFRNEFDHLTTATERLLREPETWQAVMRLADALEVAGTLEDDELQVYLPPPRPNWPPSPRAKRK